MTWPLGSASSSLAFDFDTLDTGYFKEEFRGSGEFVDHGVRESEVYLAGQIIDSHGLGWRNARIDAVN